MKNFFDKISGLFGDLISMLGVGLVYILGFAFLGFIFIGIEEIWFIIMDNKAATFVIGLGLYGVYVSKKDKAQKTVESEWQSIQISDPELAERIRERAFGFNSHETLKESIEREKELDYIRLKQRLSETDKG